MGHSLLEVFEHAGLPSRRADRQRITISGPEFDDIAAVSLRAVDHDAVLAGLQAWLGHKNIQHTVRYTELAPERFKHFWR
jgi:hypothetical protein